MPRYVILEHQLPDDERRPRHWDFMLEYEETLWVWALSDPPRPHQLLQANRLRDHRPLYLDYEGPISGNRGAVRRWDQGTYVWLQQEEDLLEVRVEGERLSGVVQLSRPAQDRELWTFSYKED